jgi:hypothetical protein
MNCGVREIRGGHSKCDDRGRKISCLNLPDDDDNEYCNGDGDNNVKWISCQKIARLHHFLTKKTQ